MKNLVIFSAVAVVMISAGIGVYAISFKTSSGTATILHGPTTTNALAASVTTNATASSTTTVTYTANGNSPQIPKGCALAKTVLTQGYRLEVYLPGAARAGDILCMLFVIQNVNHTGSPEVTGTNVNVIDANGHTMDVSGCVLTGGAATFPIGTQYSCDAGWITASPSRSTGLVPQPGTYHLTVAFAGLNITADADLTLSG